LSLFNELKRRNVFRVVIVYMAVSWLVAQVLQLVFVSFGTPDWVMKTLLALLATGLPFVVFFSWAFEMTPEGLKPEHEVDRSQSITHKTSRKLDFIIIGVMAVALVYFVYDKSMHSAERDAAFAEAMTLAVSEQADTDEVPTEYDKSIAVLPFVNMSSDPEQEYFSDGLSEELLNLLAKIPELRVSARTSSFSFKGQNLEIAEIAARLNVTHVLEGSVRKSGNQVRITAQLIKADNGFHLWSESYNRTLDDVFAIQDEIGAAVVEQLKVTLLGATPSAQETDPEAYALFLQARHLSRQETEESLARSNDLYQQVLKLDSDYAAAWSGLATNYQRQASLGLIPREEGFDLAREAANRALVINPDYAPALGILGQIHTLSDRDLAAAARYLERALTLESSNIEILRFAATLYRALGRLERAIAVCEYMVTLDPVNNLGYFNLGMMSHYSGKPDTAIIALETALSLSPGRIAAQIFIGEALLLKGEPEAALEAVLLEDSIWRLIDLPMIYHALGRAVDSDAALAELIEEQTQKSAYNIAYVLAFRGEADRAFEWLDKAVQYGDTGLLDLPIQPLFANIHDDPRWMPFLERNGKLPEQLAAIKFDVTLPE
jgi:TolB-like protein/Tfp pilus assembly protein PilF